MCRSSVVLILAPVEERIRKPLPLVDLQLVHELGDILNVDCHQILAAIAWGTASWFSNVLLLCTKSHISGVVVQFSHLATTARIPCIYIILSRMMSTFPPAHTRHLGRVSITPRTDEQLVHC